MASNKRWAGVAVIVAVALGLGLLGGVAVARPPAADITVQDGLTGVDTLFRDFGAYQAEVVSLAPFDEKSGASITIDSAHNEVHQGKMFHAEYSAQTVNNAAAVDILFRTTDTVYAHTIFEVWAGGQVSVTLFEDVAITSVGTIVPALGMNRPVTTTTAAVKVYHTPTISNTGNARLVDRIIPGGATAQTRVGGGTSKGVEWILFPGKDYVLRVVNTSGGAIPVSAIFEWYEGTAEQ